jgi:hypothetical protein
MRGRYNISYWFTNAVLKYDYTLESRPSRPSDFCDTFNLEGCTKWQIFNANASPGRHLVLVEELIIPWSSVSYLFQTRIPWEAAHLHVNFVHRAKIVGQVRKEYDRLDNMFQA